jgi:hypothetical protein
MDVTFGPVKQLFNEYQEGNECNIILAGRRKFDEIK